MSGASGEARAAFPAGLRYARWAGLATGLVLLFAGLHSLWTGDDGAAGWTAWRAGYLVLFGIWILVPWYRLHSKRFYAWSFGLLCLLALGFVFVMIFTVILDYMAAAEQGERLGVPGFQGTLVFLSLMQVPVHLFLRRPDLLD